MRAKKKFGTDYDAHHALRTTPMCNNRRQTPAPKSKGWKKAFIIVIVVIAILAALKMEADSLDQEQKTYCAMVHMNQLNRDTGWPDYAGSFRAECNPDGSVKEQK